MQTNEFIKVATKVEGNGVRNAGNWKKAYLKAYNGNIYLLSHVQAIADGDEVEGLKLHGMKFATMLCNGASNYNDWAEYINKGTQYIARNGNVYCIEITNDTTTVAAVHDATTAGGIETQTSVTAQNDATNVEINVNSGDIIKEQLTPLFGAFGANVAPTIAAAVDTYIKSLLAMQAEQIKANARPTTKVTTNGGQFTITLPDGREVTCNGIAHNKLDYILKCIFAGLHPYLYGPSGTGKTELCKQLAEVLGLPFYSYQTTYDKTELAGYLSIQNDKLVETDFYKAVTGGGICLLDELDSYAPEVATCYNSLLSNGFTNFPGVGRVTAHKDFILIAAGNTIGRGATTEFTTRAQIDAATLSRMAFIECDYDRNISISCAGGDGVELVDFVDAVRSAAKLAGVELTAGTREISSIAKLHQFVDDKTEILNTCLIKGIAPELVNNIIAYMPSEMANNAWYKALKKVSK